MLLFLLLKKDIIHLVWGVYLNAFPALSRSFGYFPSWGDNGSEQSSDLKRDLPFVASAQPWNHHT